MDVADGLANIEYNALLFLFLKYIAWHSYHSHFSEQISGQCGLCDIDVV